MSFHRFERLARSVTNPLLAKDSQGATVEGRYLYFRHLHQATGTGSELHYHPNELIIFPLVGRMNVVVGTDHRIVGPGTFVHIPAYARHATRATEDGPMEYLYIKDKTAPLIGYSARDGAPGNAAAGMRSKTTVKSPMLISGLGNCFYPLLDALDAPVASASRSLWQEGPRLGFGCTELLAGAGEKCKASAHETFLYVLSGAMRATVGGQRRNVRPGDVIEIPLGASYEFSVPRGKSVRLVGTRSTRFLETQLPQRQRSAR